MAVQDTYTQKMPEAVAGMLWDMRNVTIESYAAEGGSIPFGSAVVPGTDVRKQVKLPTAGAQGFRGIAILEQAHAQNATTSIAQYLVTEAVNVLRKGAVWVKVPGAVNEGVAAFYINSGPTAGQFSSTDDGTTDPTGGTFRTATTGAGLAVVEIDL